MTAASGPQREGLEQDLARARRLEWLGIAYLCSTVTILMLVMSGSQALKTEFIGDALSVIPPILFLVGDRISAREPTETYPFGYEKAVSAGYLGSSVALLATGAYLFGDSVWKLASQEHPIIGGLSLFGHVVWIGWLAIPALLWSAIPALFLGRAKRRLGLKLHDKVLLADAEINAADWQSAGAAVLGVLGIAWGFWWADALAALVISFEIMRGGFAEVRSALGDIMDRRPQQLDKKEPDPVPEKLTEFLRDQSWVKDAVVRVREKGREFMAEAVVVPSRDAPSLDDIERASRGAERLDERLRNVALTPVRQIPDDLQRVRAD